MDHDAPLRGVRALELGGGVAGAWCGALLADLGATVLRVEPDQGDPLRARRETPDAPETEGLLFAWLNGAKQTLPRAAAEATLPDCDFLVIGEEAGAADRALAGAPRVATLDVSWMGRSGPRAGWRGADLAAQALCGMIYPCGPVEGPPQALGDIQSALLGGVSALTAALASLLSPGPSRRFDISILEACMTLGELQYNDSHMLNRPTPRAGVNRFPPTFPIGVHACREGWLGVTLITPAQWQAFCALLDMPEQAADPGLATVHQRTLRAGELEPIIDARLAARTAEEWAALARERRVPMVVVPDAGAILDHPVFAERRSLTPVSVHGETRHAPGSPIRSGIRNGARTDGTGAPRRDRVFGGARLLDGLRIVDFSMGWAGPLATRILADLGAEVVKIEAGRYPDWWRGTDWSAEAIARKQYEESRRFTAVNRGKKSVSLDLTTPEGADLARRLVAASDAVIENHAAGVMARLGLGWADLSAIAPNLVMVSMSAFGTGNAWSDTRAYGSTLEQASGLPRFRGRPDQRPVMGHIAYGDPVGGVYAVAAMLAALVRQARGGEGGQWLNMSQVECLTAFAAPAALSRSATGVEPARRGSRHASMTPHGVYPAFGDDAWIAIAVDSDKAWRSLARVMRRTDWLGADFATAALRRAREDEIDAAIAAHTAPRDRHALSAELQSQGVIAAPVLRPEEPYDDPHFHERAFYYDTDRAHVGPQRQAGPTLLIDGARPPYPGDAPFLGGDSRAVLAGWLGLGADRIEALIRSGVVSFRPTSLRGAAPAEKPQAAPEARKAETDSPASTGLRADRQDNRENAHDHL